MSYGKTVINKPPDTRFLNQPRRIVVFNVNWLGDVVFSTAVLRNIKYNFPDAHIACIIPPRCQAVLAGNPHLDEIILFDEQGREKSLWGKIAFSLALRKKRFDTAFLLHRSFSRALIVAAAGIAQRVGYYTSKRGWLLSRRIIAPDLLRVHRIDYYLGVIAGAGLEIKDRHTEFFIASRDAEYAQRFLREQGLERSGVLAAINPGGNWAPKRWAKEYWAQLAERLISECGMQVIITGGEQDASLAGQIQQLMGAGRVISACGKLSLGQFAALCKRLRLFISADSGPLHIANAAGAVRIIALFGPTAPLLTGPYPADRVSVLQEAVGCTIPCYRVDCNDHRCMNAITPEKVMRAVKTYVHRG
ncbi:MAG TPA: lipopolysaccharide heptosyltransferase II [Candidatus Omnitrophota bacterium]|nr:lipopolysaccharide heptosyltransferase II [Candidatus Omnitrophota bacterium]HRZ14588.1 lipopolysaccharide heptosyltransferase II [Candidatus Omnitrophota bacterium]